MKNFTLPIMYMIIITASGQGAWQSLSDFPEGRTQATSFVVNDKLYVFGGTASGTLYNDLWQYNPISDVWIQKASCPCDARKEAVGFTMGNKGYIATGDNGISALNDFWEYDPMLNTWTSKPLVGTTPRSGAFSFVIGEKAYIGGGKASDGITYLNDFWVYDTSIVNYWIPQTNYNATGGVVDAISFVIGNKAYVGLGLYPGTYTNQLFSYDPALDSWSNIADYTGSARTRSVAFTYNGLGYVGWGTDAINGNTADFYSYNPFLNSWSYAFSFPNSGYRTNAIGGLINDKYYTGIGAALGAGEVSDFWGYTFSGTGTNDINNSLLLQIYPNPSDGIFTFSSNCNIKTIEIYNTLGKKVYETSANQQTSEIDLSYEPKGIYFVKVYDGEKTFNKKVIIQ